MNKTALRWLLGLALVAAVGIALAMSERFDAAALQAWVEAAGAAGPLLFMALYAVATVLFLPGADITLAGGALFGPLWGHAVELDRRDRWRRAGVPHRPVPRCGLGGAACRAAPAVPDLRLNGHPEHRLPNTLHVSFPGVSGRALLGEVADVVAASVGSACHSEHDAVSGVLAAMGADAARAAGAVRLSVGRGTTLEEVERAADALARAWRQTHTR